jgi:hypothetical protein
MVLLLVLSYKYGAIIIGAIITSAIINGAIISVIIHISGVWPNESSTSISQ